MVTNRNRLLELVCIDIEEILFSQYTSSNPRMFRHKQLSNEVRVLPVSLWAWVQGDSSFLCKEDKYPRILLRPKGETGHHLAR